MATSQGQGLVEGRDYHLIEAGDGVDATVDSVLITREAFDRVLNELQFEREKRQATEVALTAAQSMIETRDTLEQMLAQQRKDRWWQIGLGIGAGFATGYATGFSVNDTVVISDGSR